MNSRRSLIALALLLVTSAPSLADEAERYVFSYPFAEGGEMAPRGGTSRGAPIRLAGDEHPGWRALQAPGLDAFERDRRAILAMAGGYRASFDFLEVERYSDSDATRAPYQSWGTEYVYVIEDRGAFISLQHVLVMEILGQDDKVLGPFVTKHWRQDWTYEDDSVLAYAGFGRWNRQSVPSLERQGAWTQAVWQVDDSPRYEGIGRWRHEGDFSVWESAATLRPLPRREYSVRDDYQALVALNIHTITRDGWTHRQDNLKAVLDAQGRPERYLAREYGLNRYQRITDFDFSPGDEYLQRTEPFWAEVRGVWREIVERHPRFVLASEVDGEKLFSPLFAYAEEVGEGFVAAEGRAAATQIIERYLSVDADALGAAAGAGY
ncbi:MAG: DUF6607 family protein [Pseudomonadota bacterium]